MTEPNGESDEPWATIFATEPTSEPGMLSRVLRPRPEQVERYGPSERAKIAKALDVENPDPYIERLEWAITRANRSQAHNRRTVVTTEQRDHAQELGPLLRDALGHWGELGTLNAYVKDAWSIAGDETGPDTLHLPEGYGEPSDHYHYLRRLIHAVECLAEYAPKLGNRRGRSKDGWRDVKVWCCVEIFVRARGELPVIRKDPKGKRVGPILDLVLAALGASHPALVAKFIKARKRSERSDI